MKTIALNRLGILGVPKGNGWSKERQLVFLAELAKMGYRITNPELLKETSEVFLIDYGHLLSVLLEKRGGNVEYVPLFKQFPARMPADGDYLVRRIIGYLGNAFDLFPAPDAVELDNGMFVPKWLFDLSDFGADPISQMQSRDLFEKAVQENSAKQGDSHTEWIDITLAFNEEIPGILQAYLARLIYAKAAIKEELHHDFYRLLDNFGIEGIDIAKVEFKETKSLLISYFWEAENWDAVGELLDTATDILRLFAAVTYTDTSLIGNIRFPKLSRQARRMLLGVLEASHSLLDDLKTYKGIWLSVGRYLHPGEHAKRFPRVAEAFHKLRNEKIETYNGKVAQLLASEKLNKLLYLLEKRPGIYARRLHEVLRKFPKQTDKILASFTKKGPKVALKNLLVLKAYFSSINEAEYRTIVNKVGKMKILPNNAEGKLTEIQVEKTVTVIETAILKNLSERESWEDKTVWIDPVLSSYTVPLQQRKANDDILTVGRGSRVKVDFTKVLRLFVYWKQAFQRTDLDASVIQFDENFNYVGHVSYTNLAADGIAHSGDLQSAPLGAAEFIDITLSRIAKNVKYLAVQVYKFCGDDFAQMDCHAGWMMRKDVNPDIKTFDIKTVVNKFDLNGVGGYAIPLVVDVENQEIISTDLYVNALQFHNNVEGSVESVSILCQQLAKFIHTRPVMLDLAQAHAQARGATIVDSKEEAELTFGIKNCTYNANDIEQVLTELI